MTIDDSPSQQIQEALADNDKWPLPEHDGVRYLWGYSIHTGYQILVLKGDVCQGVLGMDAATERTWGIVASVDVVEILRQRTLVLGRGGVPKL